MAGFQLFERVRSTTTTTGTGTLSLAGAFDASYFAFTDKLASGDTCYYEIRVAGTLAEVGEGTYTTAGNTLSRDTVIDSTNAGALVSLPAGTKDVWITATRKNHLSGTSAYDPVNNWLGLGIRVPTERLHIKEGHIQFGHVTAPGACVAALAGLGAGNVDNGNHAYKVSYVTAEGETAVGNGVMVTVTDKTTNGQVALSSIPVSASAAVTSRNIYRTKAGGGPFYFLATVADNTTTTYTDNIADSSLPTTLPLPFSTTAGQILGAPFQLGSTGVSTLVGQIIDKGGMVRNVKAYGAVGAQQLKTNGSMTAASAVLTTSGLTAADEGKLCSVAWAGINPIANPTTAATVVANGGGATGGILAAGDYRVKYTWTTRYGETTAGTSESSVFTVAAGNIPRVTIPSLPANATGANIYLTTGLTGTTNTETQYAFGITATTADLALTARSDGLAPPTVNRTPAPLITMIKTFTNSTTCTLADAATTTVSNAEVMFGVDDTAAFQAAIDAGTGIVYAPPQSYIISQLRMKQNVTLMGAGYSSALYQRPGTNGHMIIVDDNTVDRFNIRDLLLNGRKVHQTTVNNGIHIDVSGAGGDVGALLSRVRMEYFSGHGQYMGADVRGCLTHGCYYLYNDGSNLFIDATSTDSLYIGNVGGQAGLSGCRINGNANNFQSMKMFWSGQLTSAVGYGYHITANNAELAGCMAQDNNGYDLYLDSCDRAAVSNFIFDNGRNDAVRLNDAFDNTVRGTSLSFSRNQRTCIANFVNSPLRNILAISFDAGAIAGTNEYVQGTPVGNDVSQIGPTGGYQTPAFPGTRTWTVVAATDVITTNSAHNLNDREPVYVSNSGGALPTSTPQIAANTIYYVRDLTSTTLKLATTPGGAAIDFTGTGSGTQNMQLPLQPNAYYGNIHALTQTADTPIALPQHEHQGQKLIFHLLQDGTGGRKIGFTSEYTILEFLGRTSASQLNIIEFTHNGTAWVQTGGQFTASQNSRLPGDATTTSTTAVDVADASSNKLRFAIGDSEVWSFEFNLGTGKNSGTAGIKLAITFPSGATMLAENVATTTGVGVFTADKMTASGTLGIAINTVAADTGVARITGVVVNGSTDGFVTLQFATVTSQTAKVLANSYMTARRVA